VALTLAASTLPVQPAAAERFSGGSTNVVAVEIPVEVIRDGQPVRGLSAADFEVVEGRKKLKVTGFDVVDLATASTLPGTTAISAAARRHFLFLFDFAFSDPKSVAKARQSARDLVLKGLHPTDLVAIATYSVAQGSQLALDFTSDRRQIDWAIENLGRPLEHGKSADPLRLVVAQGAQIGGAQGLGPGAAAPDPGGSASANTFETLGSALGGQVDRQNRQDQQNRVLSLSRSLADLAKALGSVDGRKFVVYLSEGFDGSLLTGKVESRDEMQQAQLDQTNPTATLDPLTNPWATDTEGRHGDTRTLGRLEKTFEEFRRADCVIQAVDIGGLHAQGDLGGGRVNGREALFSMAKETGGELYENWNDLSGAMGQMLARTAVTYVLTVQPEDLKLDGAYHRITVDLKNAPRGTRVVAKPGFYAPRPFAQRNPLERMLDAAETIVGGVESGSIVTSVLAAPFRPAAGTTAYVPVLIEVDGPGLLANQQGDVAPTEIYAYALDGSGAVRDYFSQNLGLDLVKVGPQVKQSGLKFFGHLDLPPGDYSLRVLVRNGKTGAYSLRVTPVKVPAFAQAAPFLLPPFFPEPPGRWLLTREAQRGAPQDVPYPFMMREVPYIPASRPVLGAGQNAQLSLVIYNLGDGEVQADAKVLGVDGKEMQAADLQVTDRERGSAAGPDRLTASFKAPALAPGEYQLQVTLSAGGGARQTSSILFLVVKAGKQG
jgi:VWFA-related protein